MRIISDLRDSEADGSQRMLNAVEPGSVIAVHRHKKTSETMVCLRGRLVMENYSDAGECVESIELWAGGPVVALNVPAGEWDTVRVLESGTVMLEMKDGGAIGPEDVLEL